MKGIDTSLCEKSVGKTAILSRTGEWIWNPTDTNRLSGNPVAGFAGQVYVHPSHVCQIGASDQGQIAVAERNYRGATQGFLFGIAGVVAGDGATDVAGG
jgi:hypothetical protein